MRGTCIVLVLLISYVCTFGQIGVNYQGVALQSGDLIFVGAQSENLSGAINRVTQRSADASFDHVGLLEVDGSQVYVLHASGRKGSAREPLDSLVRSKDNSESVFAVYRVTDRFKDAIPKAVERAKDMLGKPYNWSYVLNDTSYYCSDFVERAFRDVHLFKLEPMTFVNPKTGKTDDFWGNFYKKLGMSVPEGQPGCNPNGLAASTNIQRIGVLQTTFPDSIFSGIQGKLHVQGIAVDQANGYVYWSFTDRLIKTDLSGKLIGSVTGFVGHLGDLDFHTDDGKIYGSLEYKNDAIGKGIGKALGVQTNEENGFYVAVFDGAKIVRPDMHAEEEEDLLYTVYLKEPVLDYEATVVNGKKTLPHRYACSGVDGLTFGPSFGHLEDTTKYLYIAYGIYGDTTRQDNDHQVILKYNVKNWSRYKQKLSQGKLHHTGPAEPLAKYFLKTGATHYGIQNLAYDPSTGNFFAAVYKGTKSSFSNYDLFVIAGDRKPLAGMLNLYGERLNLERLSLKQAGTVDTASVVQGWHFPWGSTGLCPLGDGLFYISHNGKDGDGQQYSTLFKYKWIGSAKEAFRK